jgi:hypothetical protein
MTVMELIKLRQMQTEHELNNSRINDDLLGEGIEQISGKGDQDHNMPLDDQTTSADVQSSEAQYSKIHSISKQIEGISNILNNLNEIVATDKNGSDGGGKGHSSLKQHGSKPFKKLRPRIQRRTTPSKLIDEGIPEDVENENDKTNGHYACESSETTKKKEQEEIVNLEVMTQSKMTRK